MIVSEPNSNLSYSSYLLSKRPDKTLPNMTVLAASNHGILRTLCSSDGHKTTKQ
ncbi:hypothetical protein THF1A12_170087 [Vibrio jasicida]|uniref:Uncharacterized protein n=1 Tax=Vibrio jasicida TaxID=766224 RepID=A0AAU9QKA2_9VIBR|nr:hypothetical protein THF1A12_170087 [Vibrio jasicida]